MTSSPHVRVVLGLLVLLLSAPSYAQQRSTVPSVDAGAGECTVDFTVVDTNGKPVPGALLRMSADYGFLGMNGLDVEVRTNDDGKARFEGLPEKPDGVLFVQARSAHLYGVAASDPRDGCQIQHAIIMVQAGSAPAANSAD
jgi:hypothetical protein